MIGRIRNGRFAVLLFGRRGNLITQVFFFRIVQAVFVEVFHTSDVEYELLNVSALHIHFIKRTRNHVVVHKFFTLVANGVLIDNDTVVAFGVAFHIVCDDTVFSAVRAHDVEIIPTIEVIQIVFGKFNDFLKLRANHYAVLSVSVYFYERGVVTAAFLHVQPAAAFADDVFNVAHNFHTLRTVEVVAHKRTILVVTDRIINLVFRYAEIIENIIFDKRVLTVFYVIYAQIAVVRIGFPKRVYYVAL